jgi:hypothetical protein
MGGSHPVANAGSALCQEPMCLLMPLNEWASVACASRLSDEVLALAKYRHSLENGPPVLLGQNILAAGRIIVGVNALGVGG